MAIQQKTAGVWVGHDCYEYVEGIDGPIKRVELSGQPMVRELVEAIETLVDIGDLDVVAFSTIFRAGGLTGYSAAVYHMLLDQRVGKARVTAVLDAIALAAWHQHQNGIAHPERGAVGVLTFVDDPNGGGKCQCLVVKDDLSGINDEDIASVVGTGTMPITWQPLEAVKAIQPALAEAAGTFGDLVMWSRDPIRLQDPDLLALLTECGIAQITLLPPETLLWGTYLVATTR